MLNIAIIVISFDGVGDKEFEKLARDSKNYPNIAKFKEQSLYRGNLKTIFVSNTQPVHTTISTGKLPREHGVISNYQRPNSHRWVRKAKKIRSVTIWDMANKRSMDTAAIFWPVTCGAKIRWNMPGMCVGSHLFQLRSLLKHGRELIGINRQAQQPYLDNFAAAVACDLFRTHSPDLTLIHLLAYDAIRHKVGSKSEELNIARKSLDKNLGLILAAADKRTVLICSDHSHLDVEHTIDLDDRFGADLYEQCGGCAFFKRRMDDIESYPWFGRFLTRNEMEESGYADLAACGIAARVGYSFGNVAYMSNHGYPADYEDYRVFYAVRGEAFTPGSLVSASVGDVREVTEVVMRELGL